MNSSIQRIHAFLVAGVYTNGYQQVKGSCLDQELLTLEYEFDKVAVRFSPAGRVI